jgi:hypothetical protein
MSLVSTTTGVAVIDARTRSGTITLPLTSQIVNRYLQFKDLYGAFGRSSLTLSTQVGESFEDGTTSKVFTDPFTFISLYAASTTRWAQLGGTQTIQQTVSSLNVSSITIGSGLGWLQLPPVQTIAVSTNTLNADTILVNSTTSMYVSAQILYVSSIMGAVVGAGNLTTANLTSTVGGLGQIYLSTGGGGGGLTTGNLTSTVQGLATAGYLSSVSGATGFVSSLTVNALTMGTGVGWLQLPPIQTIYSSTIYTQAQALYSLSSYFGNTSTVTALQFNGLFGAYNNTVLAEVSTGAGTQEFLVFKGSSASDRIRFQTTGSFVVEPGVSARLWPTAPSNVTPAFIINASSNVGIQTASPGATLDVAGTARAVTLSSQQLFASTMNVTTANVSTTATISSLIVNSLQFGDGTGWINLGPTQTTVISSIQSFANTVMANQVCTGSIVVYGPSTLTVQGLSYFQNLVSATTLVVNQIGLIDPGTGQPSFFQSSNGTIEINGQVAVAAPQLLSTVAGLGTLGYISTPGGGGGLSQQTLNSTILGLGTFAYLSTAGGGGGISQQTLNSTILGLGTFAYLSTASGGGGPTSIPANLSTFAFTTSSILASTITTSSLQVNSLTIGTGTGWLNLGPLQTVAISSLQANTGSLYAANTYVGIASTLNAVQFYGLTGLYQNTAIAEAETGTGTQELLLYKVSSATDRIRFQTTGSLVFEPGVSARSWPAITSNVTAAMVITTASNVGIQTNTPGTALDVAGTGRFITMSTLDGRASSITAGIVTTTTFAVTIQSL